MILEVERDALEKLFFRTEAGRVFPALTLRTAVADTARPSSHAIVDPFSDLFYLACQWIDDKKDRAFLWSLWVLDGKRAYDTTTETAMVFAVR